MRMIGRVAAAVVLFCAALSLSSCTPATSRYLINHTGRTIQVLHSAGRWRDEGGVVHVEAWDRFWPWPFLIDPGVGRRVDYDIGMEWLIDVRAERCRVRYEAPTRGIFDARQVQAWSGFNAMRWAITVQLEPDGRLYLVAVPQTEDNRPRAVDITPFASIQPEGFPVAPSARVCRRQ